MGLFSRLDGDDAHAAYILYTLLLYYLRLPPITLFATSRFYECAKQHLTIHLYEFDIVAAVSHLSTAFLPSSLDR